MSERGLVTELVDEMGEGVRVVASYTRDDVTIEYARESIQSKLTEEYLSDLHDEFLLAGMEVPYLESLFETSEVSCQITVIENAFVFHFAGEDYHGYVISIEKDALPEFQKVVETGQEYLS